jgi:DNA-binding MarR family transcriptional regulator
MSVFNLEEQNSKLDYKIVAGLERLSQVFRILLWEKAKEHNLSPIQIQLMIFIRHHSQEKSTISYLAQEFNITKPTISDAIKVLEQKQLIRKIIDSHDTRSYTIQLTLKGKKIVSETENFTNPFTDIISKATPADKSVLWDNITNLITQLNKLEVISIQRTCYNCRHYLKKDKTHFCNLLNQKLMAQDIRIDCEEFEVGQKAIFKYNKAIP